MIELIVGTDGLFKYATSEQIASVVRDSEVATAPERLTALVRLPSGRLHDDVAIVAVAGT